MESRVVLLGEEARALGFYSMLEFEIKVSNETIAEEEKEYEE